MVLNSQYVASGFVTLFVMVLSVIPVTFRLVVLDVVVFIDGPAVVVVDPTVVFEDSLMLSVDVGTVDDVAVESDWAVLESINVWTDAATVVEFCAVVDSTPVKDFQFNFP